MLGASVEAGTGTVSPTAHGGRRPRLPLVPVWTGLVWAGVVAAALCAGVLAGSVPPVSAAVVIGLVPAALVDLRTHRLPDRLIGVAVVVLAVACAGAVATGTDVHVPGMLAGAATLSAPILAAHLISPASMGFGDVKASLVLGVAVGHANWQLALPSLAVAGAVTLVLGAATRTRLVPFGPGLVSGAVVALLAASSLVPGSDEPSLSPIERALAESVGR